MASCKSCGAELRDANRFCVRCGAPRLAGSSAATSASPRVAASRQPITKRSIAGVFSVCLVITYVLWGVLAQPAIGIRDALPEPDCDGSQFGCSLKAGFLQVAGPLLLVAIIFTQRKPAATWLAGISGTRYGALLMAPLIASLAFSLAWTATHYDAAAEHRGSLDVGVLPQALMPPIVGLITFFALRWRASAGSALDALFELRDSFPPTARIAALIVLPFLLSFVFAGAGARSAASEQIVVLMALALGFLMFTPRADPEGTGLTGQRSRALL